MSLNEIQTAAIIGAGTMGAGIAAQLADAGLQVVLLDLDTGVAQRGIETQLSGNGFINPTAAARIRTGSAETELSLIAQADWIIEAAAERLEVKRSLFIAIDGLRKTGSIVSSSTSTIRLSALTEGLNEQFAQDFLITHFFNPPRWMRLLEVVAGPRTDPAAVQRICEFAEHRLGKAVVVAKDTPAFIANRIGNFWMACALNEAITRRLDIEDADAVVGRPFGMPSGVFTFLDVVGIDLVPPAWASLAASLPADDGLQRYLRPPEIVLALIAEGRTGRKTGGGFWRRVPPGLDVLDLATREYRTATKSQPAALDGGNSDLRAILEHDSENGRYADSVICDTLAYAAALVPDVVETADLADRAMRYGYGWELGPFELIDRLGAAWLADRLQRKGRTVPPCWR